MEYQNYRFAVLSVMYVNRYQCLRQLFICRSFLNILYLLQTFILWNHRTIDLPFIPSCIYSLQLQVPPVAVCLSKFFKYPLFTTNLYSMESQNYRFAIHSVMYSYSYQCLRQLFICLSFLNILYLLQTFILWNHRTVDQSSLYIHDGMNCKSIVLGFHKIKVTSRPKERIFIKLRQMNSYRRHQ